ncbi:MAG: LamG-like jellyroll fold domain-containing protein [Anaerolineales bacterium]
MAFLSSRWEIDLSRNQSRRSVLVQGSTAFGVTLSLPAREAAAKSTHSVTWDIGRLDKIDGHAATVVGNPQVIVTPAGRAVLFDGVKDGLVIDNHPLAGFSQFTFEALVRADGGEPAQRWFHLAETDPRTGLDATVAPDNPTNDSNPRFTFELRVAGDQCYFESFTHGPTYQSALIDKTKTHQLGRWCTVTQTYDGQFHRSYVDGVLEKQGPLAYMPQGPGRASIGMRINHVSYFKGAVMRARFAPWAMAPSEFLKVPAALTVGSDR